MDNSEKQITRLEERFERHEQNSGEQHDRFMSVRQELNDKLVEVKSRVENLHDKFDDLKDTSIRQNNRVEQKLEGLTTVLNKIVDLEKADSRHTNEIYKAQKTANDALFLSQNLEIRLKKIEQSEEQRKKDVRKVIIGVSISILITLIIGLPTLIINLSKAGII